MNRMTTWSAVALLATALLAPMQDEDDPGHGLPADLQPFWTKYSIAARMRRSI